MAALTTVPPEIVREFNTSVEDTLVLTRADGAQLHVALQHFGSRCELDLAVFDMADPEQPSAKELVTLSLAEAARLRVFLNRDEIARWLDKAE